MQSVCVATPQDGEIQQLLAAREQGAGAEGHLHERLNFVAFKYQLLIDMVRVAAATAWATMQVVPDALPAHVAGASSSS